MLTAEQYQLPVKEKLSLMEELWESLDESDVVSPNWHEPILADRLSKFKKGTAELISLSELKH